MVPAAEEVIACIEHGLLPVVRVKGEERSRTLEARMRKHRVAAVSVAVFNDYEITWAKAYGLADADDGRAARVDTLFQAASISKPVTAVAALMAVERGELALDAPINDALSSWKLPGELAHEVTLRRLLSHTAGLNNPEILGCVAGTELPSVAQILDGKPPVIMPPVRVESTPGEKFEYSNGGFLIIQQALVDRALVPFPELIHERVLAPFGMTRSTIEQPLPVSRMPEAATGHDAEGRVEEWLVYPDMAAGGLWTTPSDLARFFIELQRARNGRPALISADIAKLMTTRVVPISSAGDIGLSVWISPRDGTFGHAGRNVGFPSWAIASLEGGNGIVLMSNSENGDRVFGEITRAVAAAYDWSWQPKTIERATVEPTRLARWAGRFATGTFEPFTIVVDGNRLELHAPFADAHELVPVSESELVDIENGDRLQLDEHAQRITRSSPEKTREAMRLADDARVPLLELEAGRYDAALRDYLELQRHAPDSPDLDLVLLDSLGRELLAEQRFDAALAVMRVRVALHPDSMYGYSSLGEAYRRVGNTAEAIEMFEAALATMPREQVLPPWFKAFLKDSAEKRLAELRRR